MVCDSESKNFNAVKNMYDGCKVEKRDCVGHVQKQMAGEAFNLLKKLALEVNAQAENLQVCRATYQKVASNDCNSIMAWP